MIVRSITIELLNVLTHKNTYIFLVPCHMAWLAFCRPPFWGWFHALSCSLFCQVSQPQETTWRLLIGCYGIRYCFLKSYQEATPGGGYAGGVQSLLEGERLLEVADFCRDGWRGNRVLKERYFEEKSCEGDCWSFRGG